MYYSKEEILIAKKNKDLATLERMYYEDDPNKPNLYVKLEYARMLIQKYRVADAKKVLKELMGTNYEQSARFEYGRIAVINGAFDLAREHFYEFEDRCDSQHDKDKVHYELGKLEYEAKNFKCSKEYFLSLIGSEFEIPSRLYLGKIFSLEENFIEAQKHLYPLLKTNLSSKAKFELGKIEVKMGNVDMAREYFEDCIKKGNTAAYYELGKLEFYNFNYEKAEIYLSKVKSKGDLLAKTKYCLGKKEEAIIEFESLLGTKRDVSSRLYLSLIYIKNKEYQKAFEMIHSIIDSNEIDSDIKFKTILILSKELNIYFKDYDYSPSRYYTYSNLQYIDYDSNKALEHIFANHINNPEKSNFNENIDICDLFDHIDEKLSYETLAHTLMFNDTYFIDYPNIGSKDESILKVVTLPGTKKVITMYPVENKKYYDDVNDINKSEDIIDAKRKILLCKLSKIKVEDNLDLSSILSPDEKRTLSEMFGLESVTKTLIK